jgi:hypothetical protein
MAAIKFVLVGQVSERKGHDESQNGGKQSEAKGMKESLYVNGIGPYGPKVSQSKPLFGVVDSSFKDFEDGGEEEAGKEDQGEEINS